MDLKHLIPHQRRRESGPALDLRFATDKTIVPRVGPTPTFTRSSTGTFVNENGIIVGKITSATSINPANVSVGGLVVFDVPSGSVVGWLNGSVVTVMEDTDGDDQIGAQRYVTGTILNKTNTQLSLLVTAKSGTGALASWFVSYRGARIDHNPVTLACRGLLIEESRTNLVLHSQDFTASGWIVFGTSVQTVTATNPSGGTTSQKLVESSTNVEHGVFRSNAASGTLTMSIFVKEAGRRFCYLRRDLAPNAVFDLVLGTVTQVSGSATASITSAGNGWWRISFTTTAVGNWVIKLSNIGTGVVNNSSYLGDGTSGIYIWGAQLEAGSFATSYIPTTAGSAIRSADVCSITGATAASLISSTEGSWGINFVSTGYGAGAYGNAAFLMSVAGDNGNRIGAYQNPSGAVSSEGFSSNTTRFALVNSSTVNTPHKLSFAYKVAETSSHFVDNSSPTNTSVNVAFVMPAFTSLRIGSQQMTSADYMNGTISSFRYYRKRLSNSSLQALTAIVTNTITYNGVQIQYNSSGNGLQTTD